MGRPKSETTRTKTRAQMLREGRAKGKSRMSAIERTANFQIEIFMSRKEEVNGVVVANTEYRRAPFVRIEACEQMVRNLPKGYRVNILHNPKKWLAGGKDVRIYDMCERVEAAINEYNQN